MGNLKISERTKKNIEKNIGLSFEEIVNLDLDDEIEYVEKKTGKKLSFSDKKLNGGVNYGL